MDEREQKDEVTFIILPRSVDNRKAEESREKGTPINI